MKNSTKKIKAILAAWTGPPLVITKNTKALTELKNAGITGMHRNEEPSKNVNLNGYDKNTVVVKIYSEDIKK